MSVLFPVLEAAPIEPPIEPIEPLLSSAIIKSTALTACAASTPLKPVFLAIIPDNAAAAR